MTEIQVDSDFQEIKLSNPAYFKIEPVSPEAKIDIHYKGFFWSEATSKIPFVRKGVDLVESISIKSNIPTLVKIYWEE